MNGFDPLSKLLDALAPATEREEAAWDDVLARAERLPGRRRFWTGRRALWIVVPVAAVAAAVAGIALTGTAGTGRPKTVAPRDASTVRRRVLLAISSPTNEILADIERDGSGALRGQGWDDLATGRTRSLEWDANLATDGPLIEVVSSPTTGGRRVDFVVYPARSWQTGISPSTSGPGVPSVVESIKEGLATGAITLVGPATIDGVSVLHLRRQIPAVPARPGPPDTIDTWVDATTYLPLRTEDRRGSKITSRTVYTVLPRTPDNLAKLDLVVPPGFTHTTRDSDTFSTGGVSSVTAGSGTWNGRAWKLSATSSDSGNGTADYCVALSFTDASPTQPRCGQLGLRSPATRGPFFGIGLGALSICSDPSYMTGAVVATAREVELDLSTGASVRTMVIPPPAGLAPDVGFFAVQIPCDPGSITLTARDAAGNIVGTDKLNGPDSPGPEGTGGTLVAIGSDSITLRSLQLTLPGRPTSAQPPDQTCKLGSDSPSLIGFRVGEYVAIQCGTGTLTAIEPDWQWAGGTIAKLDDGTIEVDAGIATLTCSLAADSPKTDGYHVGGRARIACLGSTLKTILPGNDWTGYVASQGGKTRPPSTSGF